MANVLGYVRKAEPGCGVEMAQANFTSARTAVANELVRIGKLGCEVRLVFSSMSSEIHALLRGATNVTMKQYQDADPDNFDGRHVAVHSKYFVVRGSYNDKPGRSIVFTGSHNLSGLALRKSDENLIKVEEKGVASAFRENFAQLWARAKCTAAECL